MLVVSPLLHLTMQLVHLFIWPVQFYCYSDCPQSINEQVKTGPQGQIEGVRDTIPVIFIHAASLITSLLATTIWCCAASLQKFSVSVKWLKRYLASCFWVSLFPLSQWNKLVPNRDFCVPLYSYIGLCGVHIYSFAKVKTTNKKKKIWDVSQMLQCYRWWHWRIHVPVSSNLINDVHVWNGWMSLPALKSVNTGKWRAAAVAVLGKKPEP